MRCGQLIQPGEAAGSAYPDERGGALCAKCSLASPTRMNLPLADQSDLL